MLRACVCRVGDTPVIYCQVGSVRRDVCGVWECVYRSQKGKKKRMGRSEGDENNRGERNVLRLAANMGH